MKIISLKYTKISAERLKEPENKLSKINLQSNINLVSAKKEDDNTSTTQTLFSVEFSNRYNYEGYADIEIKGIVFFTLDKNDKLIEEIEKTNKIDDKTNKKILIDYILRKIHVLSLSLEERLNLPYHIQSPSVSITPN